MGQAWTTPELCKQLQSSSLAENAKISLIDSMEPSISVILSELGDLPLQIAVSGQQIMVSAPLWEVSALKDAHSFNHLALKLNPLNPLSNIGLIDLPDGRELYVMFGELSAASDLSHILEEIDVLADNTIAAAELFASHLKQDSL